MDQHENYLYHLRIQAVAECVELIEGDTQAVVDDQRTVHTRWLLRRSDKDREHRLMQRIRTKARKQTRHKLLADHEAHQINRKLINLAVANHCEAVVAENLKGWRPKAGRKRPAMKARFHRWFHRRLVDRIQRKAQEAGLRSVLVGARRTSSLAARRGPVTLSTLWLTAKAP